MFTSTTAATLAAYTAVGSGRFAGFGLLIALVVNGMNTTSPTR